VDPSWRAFFATESAPPQLRVPQPTAEAAPAASHPAPVQTAVFPPAASSIHDHPTTHFAQPKARILAESVFEEPEADAPETNVESVTRSDLPPA
ncbi:hypothetical protein QP139_10435, partial [Winkia sp. UMB10116]